MRRREGIPIWKSRGSKSAPGTINAADGTQPGIKLILVGDWTRAQVRGARLPSLARSRSARAPEVLDAIGECPGCAASERRKYLAEAPSVRQERHNGTSDRSAAAGSCCLRATTWWALSESRGGLALARRSATQHGLPKRFVLAERTSSAFWKLRRAIATDTDQTSDTVIGRVISPGATVARQLALVRGDALMAMLIWAASVRSASVATLKSAVAKSSSTRVRLTNPERAAENSEQAASAARSRARLA